jgi:hypothetical protein
MSSSQGGGAVAPNKDQQKLGKLFKSKKSTKVRHEI